MGVLLALRSNQLLISLIRPDQQTLLIFNSDDEEHTHTHTHVQACIITYIIKHDLIFFKI